jgi:hypothetical protein
MHASAEPDTLVVRAAFEEREGLLEDAPDTYYVTDYYRRYPVVLVRLAGHASIMMEGQTRGNGEANQGGQRQISQDWPHYRTDPMQTGIEDSGSILPRRESAILSLVFQKWEYFAEVRDIGASCVQAHAW